MLPKSMIAGSGISGLRMYHRASPPTPEFGITLVFAASVIGLVMGIAVVGVIVPTIVDKIVVAIAHAVAGA